MDMSQGWVGGPRAKLPYIMVGWNCTMACDVQVRVMFKSKLSHSKIPSDKSGRDKFQRLPSQVKM